MQRDSHNTDPYHHLLPVVAGPASQLNLEVPEYAFNDEEAKLVIG